MTDWLRPLFRLFYVPARGMAEVRERAPLGPAVVLALLAQSAFMLYMLWPELFGPGELARNGLQGLTAVVWTATKSVLFTAIIFVPVVIFVANVSERRASFGLALQQEYATVASTVLYASAAASLLAIPCAVFMRVSGIEALFYQESAKMLAEWAQQQGGRPLGEILAEKPFLLQESLATLRLPLLGVWVAVAVREVFRLAWLRTLAVVMACTLIMFPLGAVLGPVFDWVLASPFLLVMLFFLMRGYFGEVMRGQRARASFKQNLEAATLNPADASAHYNLGLIHLQRKELAEARRRFERAVEIDADEVDAHFQLGRISRADGRLADAIGHFTQVVERNPTHAQHEIWREVGATYVAAGQFTDAEEALERFLEKRRSDPEGLYLMGRALFGMERRREAREWMQACIEAVKTAPAYKYRTEKRWLNEAQQFLRSQA
ncbi:MAG TPA: tetratricopeptide repeat protein [Pyrinomonadaceae bacterium]|jgi:tetratricopeptide (TPR) repeat protein|nr:tetratricopeptide repeat protein [Pyrinomonadaceae bacterium]